MDRREHTTALIRNAARAEFAEVGPRALSLQRVAGRAFVSVGAVYERWPNKQECIRDLVAGDLPLAVAAIEELWTDDHRSLELLVYRNLFDSAMVAHLRFIAECVFAARDDETLAPTVRAGVEQFTNAVMSRTRPTQGNEGLGWWVASSWLGYALLKPAGCSIPDSYVGVVASIVDHVGHMVAEPEVLQALRSDSVEFLPDRVAIHDPTAQALIAATQAVVDARGGDAVDVRSVAQAAGVTTGALYRRFSGRSELLVTAFASNLPADRYAWTQPLLAAMQAGGLRGGAQLLAGLCERIWVDQANANALLEYSIAAHADAALRSAISAEIERVADRRSELFASLIAAGIVRSELPADALGWTFQVPPVGMRLLASIGIVPEQESLVDLLDAYLNFLMAPATTKPDDV